MKSPGGQRQERVRFFYLPINEVLWGFGVIAAGILGPVGTFCSGTWWGPWVTPLWLPFSAFLVWFGWIWARDDLRRWARFHIVGGAVEVRQWRRRRRLPAGAVREIRIGTDLWDGAFPLRYMLYSRSAETVEFAQDRFIAGASLRRARRVAAALDVPLTDPGRALEAARLSLAWMALMGLGLAAGFALTFAAIYLMWQGRAGAALLTLAGSTLSLIGLSVFGLSSLLLLPAVLWVRRIRASRRWYRQTSGRSTAPDPE